MSKTESYERIFIKYNWFFLSGTFLYSIIYNCMNHIRVSAHENITLCVFLLFLISLNFIKYQFVSKCAFNKTHIYLAVRGIELLSLVFAVGYLGIFFWTHLLIIFTIGLISLCKGIRYGFIFTSASLFMHLLMTYTRYVAHSFHDNLYGQNFGSVVLSIVFFYGVLMVFASVCGAFYKNTSKSEEENKRLLAELEEKYEQLALAQDEIKFHYEKLKETNQTLEDTNNKLLGSVAEFYTLQQISQAISSVLEIKELLKYVNDIILGVMGVNHASIMLYDEKTSMLRVHTTNITSPEERALLNDHINCQILLHTLDKGKNLLENFVDSDEYIFTKGRDVNSLICVPLYTKTRKFGLVLIEHKHTNAFSEENVRLLDIIGQQVGIAMENAELYQKMQELATIDGLTGVYNRVYFQERLQNEFKHAKDGEYELSLAIFDIDHFKKFNDTYGHLFGDKVLKFIGDLVKSKMRSADIVARYGGEEFIILFPRTSIDEACLKVEELRIAISETIVRDELVESSVTASFGVATFPLHAKSESELIRRADYVLYEAKGAGRNCVRAAS